MILDVGRASSQIWSFNSGGRRGKQVKDSMRISRSVLEVIERAEGFESLIETGSWEAMLLTVVVRWIASKGCVDEGLSMLR
jgi:urease gamma subunit